MAHEHFDTEIALYDFAGRPQMVLKGRWTLGEAILAAEAYLGLLSDVEAVRVCERMPWGDEHATRITRGLHGPEIEPELPYAAN